MEDKLKDILLDLMLRHRCVIRTSSGGYRFVCEYYKDQLQGHACPNNHFGICCIDSPEINWLLVHRYDGMKVWKCPCG